MGTDPSIARDFVAWYGPRESQYQQAAGQLRRVLSEILLDESVEHHVVLSREKTLFSLRDKLRRKSYEDPQEELTDLVAARVIVYYDDDVDSVVNLLRLHFEEHPELTIDKRSVLETKEFGYRSFHQVLRLSGPRAKNPEYGGLKELWCEVQVRTVLEHAWAEIEHEVAYKSGTRLPEGLKRRFSAIAGALEILDHEFVLLRDECRGLVEERLAQLRDGEGLEQELDASWLLACLELRFPDGRSFRAAADTGSPFPPKVEARVLPVLWERDVITVDSWLAHLESERFATAAERYAANSGCAPNEISHFAVLAIAVTVLEPETVAEFFQELLADPAFQEAIA